MKLHLLLLFILSFLLGWYTHKHFRNSPVPLVPEVTHTTDTLYLKGKDSLIYRTLKDTASLPAVISGNCDSCKIALDTTVTLDTLGSKIKISSDDLITRGLSLSWSLKSLTILRTDTLKILDSVFIPLEKPTPIYATWQSGILFGISCSLIIHLLAK